MQRRDIEDRAFAFALQIIRLCDQLETRRRSFRKAADQLLRAGMSIGANLEEARAGQTKRDTEWASYRGIQRADRDLDCNRQECSPVKQVRSRDVAEMHNVKRKMKQEATRQAWHNDGDRQTDDALVRAGVYGWFAL